MANDNIGGRGTLAASGVVGSTDKILGWDASASGAARSVAMTFDELRIWAQANGKATLGFGFDGGGNVIVAGSKFRRVVSAAGTITGWRIVGDVSGSVSLDVKKGTPSGGAVTLSSIVASAAPALSSQQVVSSTTLTGWTTSLAVGDVVEVSITGTPAAITTLAFSMDLTQT